MHFEKSGVPGLDEILKGGIRNNSSIIVRGGPGSGKTILALQFIIQGAKEGQTGVFISAEEELDDLRDYAKSIGLDLEEYEKKKLVYLIKQPITLNKIISFSVPLDLIKKGKIKRVVVDSLSIFRYGTDGELTYRKELLYLINNMRSVLFMATAEEKKYGVDTESSQEDFLFDGIIRLIKVRKENNFERCLFVSKMRGQEHSINIFPFEIKKLGLIVYPKQIPFSLIGENSQNTNGFKK